MVECSLGVSEAVGSVPSSEQGWEGYDVSGLKGVSVTSLASAAGMRGGD